MEIKKKISNKYNGESRCAIRFSSKQNMVLNSASRDYLKKPAHIRVEYEDGIIILGVGDDADFKVSVTKTGQALISGSAFMGRVANIPSNTKIYGNFKDGKIYFEIPSEYRKS